MNIEVVLLIICIIFLVYIARFFKSPQTKGELGELRVKLSLGKNIQSEKYVINDLLILVDSKSHQIDHIIIRKSGIFVIETKNFSGQIYGQENQKEWTQVLAYGQEKHRFYNPILQNRSHIYALSKIIGRNDCFISIIVFPKADIMTNFDSYVGSISDMKRWLNQDRQEVFTPTEVEKIYAQLVEFKNNPRLTNEQHIENIYTLQRKIENNICPRCGKELIIRNGKFGTFYGCSGYPSCKFMKK